MAVVGFVRTVISVSDWSWGTTAVSTDRQRQVGSPGFAVLLEDADRPENPIIALTAHAIVHDYEKYTDAGYDDCVSKPNHRANLLATIARHVPYTEEPAALLPAMTEDGAPPNFSSPNVISVVLQEKAHAWVDEPPISPPQSPRSSQRNYPQTGAPG